MFYNAECPNCMSILTFDALHSKMQCTTCHTLLSIKKQQIGDEQLLSDMEAAFKRFQFLRAEQLADAYLADNPTNARVYACKAATMIFNEMHFTRPQLVQSFEYFETAYTLAQNDTDKAFIMEQMNSAICALYLHHLKLASQQRDLDSLPSLEKMYNDIASLQFTDETVRYMFLLYLAQAHDIAAKDLNRHYIRCSNTFNANHERTHADTKMYAKDLLFFSVIAKFLAKRAEILNQLSTVQLDDALTTLYNLLIHRYNEELDLSYFVAIDSFSGTDYHEVNVTLDEATLSKLRTYRESYTLMRTKVGLRKSG